MSSAWSLQFKQCHFQRIITDCATLIALFQEVPLAIVRFHSALLVNPVFEHQATCFLSWLAGLGISDPLESAHTMQVFHALANIAHGDAASELTIVAIIYHLFYLRDKRPIFSLYILTSDQFLN